MGKKNKRPRSRTGMQAVTLCISTTMVLVLLGLMVFSMLTAHNLSAYMRQSLTVTVMLGDSVSVNNAHLLCRSLYHRPYAHSIDYISKEQAQREQCEAMGSDPSEFLGFNPFTATLEMKLRPDYANRDSLRWIAKEVKADKRVTDVAYQEDLMDAVNTNLHKASLLLLILAALLTIVSFSLISNTVRLSVYSRRFTIHTMKLVGASWGFIRRPFLRDAVGVGIAASLLAVAVLAAAGYGLVEYEPGIVLVVSWPEAAITAAAVVCFGIIITALCAWLAVNKFLRMKAGTLYKL